jgi:hypothetical protein
LTSGYGKIRFEPRNATIENRETLLEPLPVDGIARAPELARDISATSHGRVDLV